MSGRTTININSESVYANVDESDDLFNVFPTATLVLRGADILTDDAITGAGWVRVSGQVTIDDGLTLDNTVTFANAGMVTQNGVSLLIGETASDAATVRNNVGATWSLSGYSQIGGLGASQFINIGLIEQSGYTAIDVNFYDRGGTIDVGGIVDLVSPNNLNRFVNDQIEGAGEIELSGGVLVGSNISTATAELASVRTVGAVTISSTTVTIQSLDIAAGSILSLTNPNGSVGIGSGVIQGAGEIDVEGDYGFILGSLGDSATLMGGVTFDNFGASTFSGGYVLGSEELKLAAAPAAGSQITIENEVGATWEDIGSGSVYSQVGGSGSSVFINDGSFIEETLGGSFSMNVVNNGVMSVGAISTLFSGLSFDDAVSGTGTIDVGGGRALFAASVGSGETVSFNPVSASGSEPKPNVTIDHPESFSGVIAGFGQNGATNDRLIVNTATWQYQDFVANSEGNGGALIFSNGSAETAVSLTGAYDPLGFHGAVSGASTTITYSG
jgi:hypothetical protein